MEKRLTLIKAAEVLRTAEESLLYQRANDCIIMGQVETLFENVMLEILESGAGRGFSGKEVTVCLYKRERSRYFYVDVTYDNLRIRKSTKCENRRDAEKIKLHLLLKMMNLVPAVNQNQLCPMEAQENLSPTFAEASQKYLEEKATTTKSLKREKLCHKDVVGYFGSKRIDKITPQDIHSFMQAERKRKVRCGKNLSARSINYNRGYLHRVFEFALNVYGWAPVNPVRNIDPLPEDNMRDRVLSLEEEKTLLSCIEKEWLRDITTFALDTGLRIGEVASLRKGNFHMAGDMRHFKLKREKGGVWTEFPITSPMLMSVIEKYLNTGKGDTFFCSEGGETLTSNVISKRFRQAVNRAGINNFIFHDLRRTFYSRLRLRGCNPTVAEYLMGHKQRGLIARYLSYDLHSIAGELRKMDIPGFTSHHMSHFGEDYRPENDLKIPLSVAQISTSEG